MDGLCITTPDENALENRQVAGDDNNQWILLDHNDDISSYADDAGWTSQDSEATRQINHAHPTTIDSTWIHVWIKFNAWTNARPYASDLLTHAPISFHSRHTSCRFEGSALVSSLA